MASGKDVSDMESHADDCEDSPFSYSKLDDATAEKMRDALTAIVQEIKRLDLYWRHFSNNV